MAKPTYTHALRLTYAGPTNTKPSRYIAAWEGWPSGGPRIVRKSFSYDYSGDAKEIAALQAVQAFAAWIGNMPGDDDGRREYTVASVTIGALPDCYAVLFNLESKS